MRLVIGKKWAQPHNTLARSANDDDEPGDDDDGDAATTQSKGERRRRRTALVRFSTYNNISAMMMELGSSN